MICARSAAADERPVVSDASPYVAGSRIVCDVNCGGLFSEKIVGTVKSGLPAVVELLYTIETRDGDVIGNGIHSFELRYDVWEDVYSIVAGDSNRAFASFDEMGSAIDNVRGLPIIPVEMIDPSLEYAVRLTVAVHPLAGSEKRRLEGFVEESVGARSHGSWREQALNINELISRFFSRDKGVSNRSDVYRTDFFAPADLPGAKFPVEGGGGGGFGEATVAMEVR
jgi:hypothetical protein